MSVASGLVSKLSRRARWAVPVGTVAAVALAIAGSSLAGAQGAPQLPARTTAQLLAAVGAPSALPSAMQAVVQETANLGLPNLPGSSASDPLSGLSLLSGSHTIKVWYDGPTRVRIAIPVTLGEADLRRDGSNVWIWDSKTNRATHYVLPAGAGETPAEPGPAPTAPTPQQLARQILAAVGPTTTVGLQPNVTVAGQAAYQLSLAPKDHRSLIGQVRIAIDARNSLPLRVQVFARGASAPAFELAYTSLSFTRPAASNFAFTPPPGATVKTVTVPDVAGAAGMPADMPLDGVPPDGPVAFAGVCGQPAGGSGQAPPAARPGPARMLPATKGTHLKIVPGKVGAWKAGSWTVVGPNGLPASVRKRLEANFARQLPASLTKAQRAAALKRVENALAAASQAMPARPFCPVAGPRVLGRDWLSVLVLPSAGLLPTAGFWSGGPPPGSVVYGSVSSGGSSGAGSASAGSASAGSAGAGSSGAGSVSSSQSTVTFSSGAVSGGPGIDTSGLGSALLGAARPVHGSWGSGRLLRTSLLSILITTNGQVLIGAVQPSVLYADAAQLPASQLP